MIVKRLPLAVNKNFIHQNYRSIQCIKNTTFLKVQASMGFLLSKYFHYSLSKYSFLKKFHQYLIYMNKGK